MENKYANFCKNILYEIRHNAPLKKIRNEWNKLHNLCISQNINATKNLGDKENGCFEYSSSLKECEGYEDNSRLVLTANKLSVEITQNADKNTITNYIQSGIFNFGIDLFFGSVEQNLEVLVRLQEAALEVSQTLGISIPMSVYLKLSPRQQYTGGLWKNKLSFNLGLQNRVNLTTDRKYALRSCHRTIYINAKFLFFYLQKCDMICLGEKVQLQVVEIKCDHVVCTVIVPGIVTPRMLVKFPPQFEWAQSRVSAEELEDITFAVGTNINIIVSHVPKNPAFCEQLRETLTAFKCDHYYLFTRLKLSDLKNVENAKWIACAYDGFLIDCTQKQPINNIVKLSPEARIFIEDSFRKRKPILLHGSWSLFVHPSDYQYAFYYPDKYVLPCSSEFLHLFEAVFNKLAPGICTDKFFHDISLTGSTTLARSIAAASFDFQADAIIMCTISGQMAAKIAHFRPRSSIIAVTNIASVINYTSMHHNVLTLLFDMDNDKEVSHKRDTHQKLVYGVRYAMLKKLIDSSSTIILVYRKILRYGFTDKFLVVKFDEEYVETIRNAILQK